jgi:hypothetical protein
MKTKKTVAEFLAGILRMVMPIKISGRAYLTQQLRKNEISVSPLIIDELVIKSIKRARINDRLGLKPLFPKHSSRPFFLECFLDQLDTQVAVLCDEKWSQKVSGLKWEKARDSR